MRHKPYKKAGHVVRIDAWTYECVLRAQEMLRAENGGKPVTLGRAFRWLLKSARRALQEAEEVLS